MLDEEACISKVPYLYGSMAVYTAGISVKVGAHYPGRPQSLPEGYYRRKAVGRALRSQQKAK